MFGSVHGWSGAPALVAAGLGPERSRPIRRLRLSRSRTVVRSVPMLLSCGIHQRRRLCDDVGQLDPEVLARRSDLRLDLSLGQRALADHDAQGAADQLGVGELLPRPRLTVVVEGIEPCAR